MIERTYTYNMCSVNQRADYIFLFIITIAVILGKQHSITIRLIHRRVSGTKSLGQFIEVKNLNSQRKSRGNYEADNE